MGNSERATSTTELKSKYIVWSPTSTLPPTAVFASRPEAIKVAHLMATKNKGERFAVAKLVGVAQAEVVKFESFSD